MSARSIAAAVAVAVALVPAACAPRGPGECTTMADLSCSAPDANGQCAARQIQIAPVAYEAPAPAKTRYTFVASVLTEECSPTGMHGPNMIVNVWMRQSDPSGHDNPVGINHVNREEQSPFTFSWSMDRGYAHELLGDATVNMTAGQIDDWDAGFIECQWLMNGAAFPAGYSNLIVQRQIKPIRAGQEVTVECHGNLPPD